MKTVGDFSKLNNRISVNAEKMLSNISAKLKDRGHRVDLQITDRGKLAGKSVVVVGYQRMLGEPSEKDIQVFVQKSIPGSDVDWSRVSFKDGHVIVGVRKMENSIPLKSFKDVPTGFKSVGTGFYRRAEGENKYSIWEMKKDPTGKISLVRTEDETSVQASEFVSTPEGIGILLRFGRDKSVVMLNGRERVFATHDLRGELSPEEQKKLVDYFTKAYGDAAYAKQLVTEKLERARK